MSSDPTIGLTILTEAELAEVKLEAIKAFVKRVEERLPEYDTGRGADSWLKAYRRAVHEELATMEPEESK